MISQDQLKTLVHYDPETGIFTSKKWHARRNIGSVLGCPSKSGYLRMSIDYKLYYLHRLAYLYMVGEWPLEIDHINRVRADNRWCNLRWANRSINVRNRAPKVANV